MFKDMLGFELQKGDVITYPVRSGSSMWMSMGRIETLTEKPCRWNPKRTEQTATVTVCSSERHFQGRTEDGKPTYTYTHEFRKVGFRSFDRCIKLHPHQIDHADVDVDKLWFNQGIGTLLEKVSDGTIDA